MASLGGLSAENLKKFKSMGYGIFKQRNNAQ